jgi:hypothetical protein
MCVFKNQYKDFNMIISKFHTQKTTFGESTKPPISVNRKNDAENIISLSKRLNAIIAEIGGLELNSDIQNKPEIALIKIERLKEETKKAWLKGPALDQKLKRLSTLKNELLMINESIKQANDELDQKQTDNKLILPGENKEKLIVGSDARYAYNILTRQPVGNKNQRIQDTKQVFGDAITLDELHNSIKELKKDDWSFEKLNSDDSKIYTKLNKQLIVGSVKEILENQIKILDEKLAQIQDTKGVLVPQVGIKLYTPQVTGQILALETAKLRRLSVQYPNELPLIEQQLSKPDVLAQPISSDLPVFFKIDKHFIPKKVEIQEILKLNEPYKPVLNKLFPDGLKVFLVPGYTNDKTGEIEGGMSITGHPDKGVWLTSYNIEERFDHVSKWEKRVCAAKEALNKATTGKSDEIENFKPSVLSGNKDRARALAHEIGHVISNKTEENTINSADLLNISLMDGWKFLRTDAKFNDVSFEYDAKGMTDNNKKNLRDFLNYEMIAEDIRQTFTSDEVPASSRMTGIFDQTKEGKEELSKVKKYIKTCLIDGKSASETIFKMVQKQDQ